MVSCCHWAMSIVPVLVEYFTLAKEQPELVRRYRQALAATLN